MKTRYQVFQINETSEMIDDIYIACQFIPRGKPHDDPADGMQLIKNLTDIEPKNVFTQLAVFSKGE